MPVVVIIKRKSQKISHSSFVCWELSRVNSFYFFSFLWGSRRPYWKCLVALICMIDYLYLEPILLVFSLELNACRFQLSPMHVHSYYYTLHSVVGVKGIMMIYDGLIEMRTAGMNSTSFVFVNMMSSSFLIHLIMK